jgi:hypothetical protein
MKRLACTILSLLALFACGHSVAEGGSHEHAILAEAEMPEADFLDTLGVNAHLNYTDGAYARLDLVAAHMRYLGLVHLRTHGGGDVVPLQEYVALAAAGIRFNLIATADRIGEAVDFAAGLMSRTPGSVVAIEGFNEVNNWPVAYRGLQGEDAARAAQAELYAEVRARSELGHVPVLYFTGGKATGDLSGMADMANVHAYSDNALQPRPFIENALRNYSGAAAHLPFANTEFGNFTLPEGWPERKPYWANATQLGVDEATQAKIVLNSFFEGAALGVSRSYVYELLDEKPDPDGTQPELHFGLFTFDHRPKASAKALHNLTGFFERTRSVATRGTVEAKVEDSDDAIGSIAIRREDGSLLIGLWNRSEFWRWDQYSSEPAVAPSRPATVWVSTERGRIKAAVFNPLNDTVRSLRVGKDGRVSLKVPDYPVIVHLRAL